MVDRKAVLTNLKNFYEWKFKNYPLNFDEAQVIIKALETETPHAKWIDTGKTKPRGKLNLKIYKCSWCNNEHEGKYGANFCEVCGAIMDGE